MNKTVLDHHVILFVEDTESVWNKIEKSLVANLFDKSVWNCQVGGSSPQELT